MDHLCRILHPSGHGAFFTEIISQDGKDDFIVVYDCGSSDKYPSERVVQKKEIDDFFQKGDVIDILFISHFDSDHVNGIKWLKPYLSKNTKLIMPFSYEYFYLKSDSPILLHMSMVMGIVDDLSIKKYWVRYADIGRPEVSEEGTGNINGQDLNTGFLESGTRMGFAASPSDINSFKWIYVPFNLYDDRGFRERFEKEVKAKFAKEAKDIEALDLDAKAIEKLREIYKNLGPYKTLDVKESTRKSNGSKNINFNSLIVLSKAVHYNCDCYDCPPYRFSNCKNKLFHSFCDGSCLYTGDSNFGSSKHVVKLDSILRRYTKLPICLFQLPHHGSRQYYCKDLMRAYDMFTTLFVNCGQYDFKQDSFPQMLADVEAAQKDLSLGPGPTDRFFNINTAESQPPQAGFHSF